MKSPQSKDSADLRSSAEARLKKDPPLLKDSGMPEKSEAKGQSSEAENERLLHDLEVHHVELEMQNEELLNARADLETVVARYTELYDFAPVGYFALKRDGAITQTNLAGERLLDIKRAWLSGKRFGVFVDESSLVVFNAFLLQVWELKGRQSCEVALATKGQLARTVYIEAALAADEEECHAVVLDITERKNAEKVQEDRVKVQTLLEFSERSRLALLNTAEDQQQMEKALRASEAQHRNLIQHLTTGVVVHAPDMRIILHNQTARDLLGLSSEQMLGKVELETDWCFVYENKTPLAVKEYPAVRVIATHVPIKNQVLGIHRQHTLNYVWVLVSAFPEFEPNGQLRQVVVTFSDITERKQEDLYRQLSVAVLKILNNTSEFQDAIQQIFVALKQTTGCEAVGIRLQSENDFPYLAVDGFSDDFVRTENKLTLLDQAGGMCRNKDGTLCLECLCGLVISGQADLSNPLFTKGGSAWTNDTRTLLDLTVADDPRLNPRNRCIHEDYLSVALIPLRSKMGIIGLLQLNSRKQDLFNLAAIEALEGLASHIGEFLMRQQAEAEHEKIQSQLNQAQKTEAIGRLAGGVAHDFNNMLQAILGYTDMALNETDPEIALYNDLTEIRKAANRSANLTRQLLAFARKQTMTPQVIDLNETVSGMLRMLRQLIGEDIELAWQPTAADTTVKMDPSQIDQILANLCVNARDAIAGVGALTVETGTLTADAALCAASDTGLVPGEYVTLSVSDTGCGMDEETIKHIFEPFYTTKRVGKGTGLGLATVYGIVKQNNGNIKLTSVPEKGTTFRICLPRHLGEAAQLPLSGPPKAALRGHDTVLLVEDEPAILKMGKRMLESLGYRVLTAGLPDEAVALVKKNAEEIGLLLTDVVMPQMNGLDLAAHLTQLHPELKCMFMSGYTADIITKQGLVEEGVHFIQKPFTVQDLAAKVQEALKD